MSNDEARLRARADEHGASHHAQEAKFGSCSGCWAARHAVSQSIGKTHHVSMTVLDEGRAKMRRLLHCPTKKKVSVALTVRPNEDLATQFVS